MGPTFGHTKLIMLNADLPFLGAFTLNESVNRNL